jgi:hypothetical protein
MKPFVVTADGILRGEGHKASCRVSATKVGLLGAPGIFEYTNFSIEKVSKALPAGIYQLSAFGKNYSVRYENGYLLEL